METIEKAKELMQKAYDLDKHNKTPQSRCKEIALLCVDEMLWSLNDIDGEINMGNYIPWWEEVREDILTL